MGQVSKQLMLAHLLSKIQKKLGSSGLAHRSQIPLDILLGMQESPDTKPKHEPALPPAAAPAASAKQGKEGEKPIDDLLNAEARC